MTAYRTHERQVLQHFAHRPGRLLRLRIGDGEGWPRLCAFFGKAIPSGAFPHEHDSAMTKERTAT